MPLAMTHDNYFWCHLTEYIRVSVIHTEVLACNITSNAIQCLFPDADGRDLWS